MTVRALALSVAGASLAGVPAAAACEDGRPLSWDKALIAKNGRSVKVAYTVNPALPLRRAVVRSGPRRVRVTLYQEKPAEGALVSDTADVRCVRIPLAEPLRGRRLVDGVTGRRPRGSGVADYLDLRRARCPGTPTERR